MHKENQSHHPHETHNPLGIIEQGLVENIMQKFGTNVQIFYQRKPSRNNLQTESEKAFEEFMRGKFGPKLGIAYEPQEFVRITKPNGSLCITTSLPDYEIKLRNRRGSFAEITSSPRMKTNGKRKNAKHNLIMKMGFGKDVDSIIEFREPQRTRRKKTKTFGFRVLLPNGKMLLVRIPMRINKSIIKSGVEAVANPRRTKSVILYGENLRKIEEKQHVRIIYDRANGKQI